MTMKAPRARWHLATADVVERIEDSTYIVVAALLVIAGLFLLWSVVSTLVVDAGIRRLLILTAQAAENPQTFRWNPGGIELALLTGLVLVMTISLVLWRRLYLRDGEVDPSTRSAEVSLP